MAENKDYYKILGVERNATEDEIKKRYKHLAVEFHPDKFATASEEERKEAEDKFKEINEAYSVLSNKEKRAQYDNPQPEGWDSPFFHGFNPFGNPFRQERRVNVGTDIKINVHVSLEDAYNGTLKKIKFKRKEHCPDCNGTGSSDGTETTCPYCKGTGMFREERRQGNAFFSTQYPCPKCGGTGKTIKNPCKKCSGTGLVQNEVTEEIDIPSGIFSGAAMQFEGKGNFPKGEGIPGSMIIVYTIDNDENYKVEGLNIIHEEEVPFNEALLGCAREVKLIDGTNKKVTIPECCENGKEFVFSGKGMPNIQNPFGGNGDFIIRIKYKLPKKLNKEQKNVLKSFQW